MRRDLDELEGGGTFESDVCCIGGGIAGLVLASRLARHGKRVHLVEAGGPNPESRSQELYRGAMQGVHHRGTTEGRYRTFGGSSIGWAAQLLPYPPEVFRAREAAGQVGWPISSADLEPYYGDVHAIMQADSLSFDRSFLDRAHAADYPLADGVRVRFSKWAPFSRRNFANTLGRECVASDQVEVFFHANAIALEFAPEGPRVTSLTVQNYAGGMFTFRSRQFVISAGTIETSRLLLYSFARSSGRDAHDQVGRYFFDHVSTTVAAVAKKDFTVFRKKFAPFYMRKTMHTPRFETSEHFQDQQQILAVMGHFEFEEPEGTGLVIFRRFLHDIQAGRFGRGQKLSDLPGALLGGARTVFDLKVRGRRLPTLDAALTLRLDVEQKPDADSRILLGDQPDRLGVPELVVRWRRSPDEIRAMRTFLPQLEAYFRQSGMELDWRAGLFEKDEAWANLGADCFHPMGGARMGTSPATSVVDRDLRVHGLENLYVASCAVYPTGGSSNPTFSLMALSLRLADMLGRGQSR